MYQVLGVPRLLTGVGAIILLVFLVWAAVVQPSDLSGWFRVIWGSVSGTVLVVGLLGELTPVVPWLARRWPFKYGFPDLDGLWRARLTSNWPMIAKAHGLPSQDVASVMAEVRITVRLLRVRMQLTSDTNYSESDTVAVRVLKNQDNGDVSLY